MEHKLHNRILSALLALVLVLTGFPVAAFAEGESVAEPETALCDVCGEEPCICMPEAEEDTADEEIETSADFAIFCDGLAVSALELCRSEKRTVTAENLPEGCTHQWQIYVPGASFWVNISGQTDESLDLSFALLGNLLDETDTALVRCAALCDGAVAETSGVLAVAVVDDPAEEKVSAEETPVEEAPVEEEPEIELVAPVPEVVLGAVTLSDDTETITDEDTTYYTVTIEYYYADTDADGKPIKDSDGKLTGDSIAFSSYEAKLRSGASFSTTVASPTLLGYSPVNIYGEDCPSVTLSYTDLNENQTVVVFYRPAEVTYTVRYFVQNIYNDLYVEHSDASGMALTGTYPAEIDKVIPGFTKLYNYPEVVAADGSTEFQIYYDRNYYLYNFNLSGGYGAEPVYARYETMLSIPDPTRAGWNFAGWDLTSITGEPNMHTSCTTAINYGDGAADTLTPRVCIFDDGCTVLGNYTYTALWERYNTTFSVVYWVQNADDDGYSYAYSAEGVEGKTGNVVNLDNIGGYKDPNTGTTFVTTLPDDNDLYEYSVLDVDATKKAYATYTDGNGTSETGVQLQGDGSTIFNIYFARKEYTLRFVYARKHTSNGTIQIATNTTNQTYGYTYKSSSTATPTGKEITDDSVWTTAVSELPTVSESGTTTGTFVDGDYEYYFISLSARYRKNLENLWPSNADDEGSGYLSKVDDYSCVGWCAHYQSYYADSNYLPSAVVTGTYSTLDAQILMDPAKTTEEEHYLLAQWSANEYLWEYRFYVGITDEEYAEDSSNTFAYDFATAHPYWHYWKLVDSQITYSYSDNKSNQPRATIPGIRYTARHDQQEDLDGDGDLDYVLIYYYYRYEHSLVFNNYGDVLLSYATPFEKPTTPGSTDWEFQYVNGVKGEYQWAEGIWNLYESAYAVDYGISLDSHVTEANAAIQTAYPSTLEPEAYEFMGWYTGPDGAGDRVVFDSTKDSNFVDSVAGIWYNPTMPDDDLILFAYWAPKTYTINFYESYEALLGNDVYDAITVTHGAVLQTTDLETPVSPYAGATFAGWFYYDEFGTKHAFDPETMTVNGEMKLFAEWGSSTAASYTVSYVCYDSEGNKISLGDDTDGWGYVGSTKTFTALSFSDGDGVYFPETSSHSIVIKEPTETDPTPNTYTFVYVQCEKVSYKVQFYDDTNKRYFTQAEVGTIAGGTWKTGTDGNDYALFTTSNAVEDIRYTYISDYLVDASYKRLYLSAEVSEDDIVNNVVTFVYTKDSLHARYVVRHMTETLTSGEYEEYVMIDYYGDISDTESITESALTITGFTCNNITITLLDGSAAEKTKYTITEWEKISTYLPAQGVEVVFTYTRNSYYYRIQYQEYGTNTSLQTAAWSYGKFKETITPYSDGTDASLVPGTITKDGITYYLREGESDKTIEIRAVGDPYVDENTGKPANPQTITYYYEAKSTSVVYRAITVNSTLPGGTVTPEEETIKTGSFSGSVAKAGTGFTFYGWYSDAACENKVTSMDGTVTTEAGDTRFAPSSSEQTRTFYALFEPNSYTITFDTDGGTEIDPIIQNCGTTVTAPTDPTKTGYTFAGWDKNIPTTMPAENMTIKAKWKVNQYTITFANTGDTTIAPIKQDYGTAVTAPADPTKTGYTFAGWDKEIPATMPAEDMTITAKWTVNQYTITFDTDGGTEIAAITQDYGSAVTAPADPTKTGYTFAGWDKEIPATMPAENLTIKAQWTINQYTITFVDADGTTELHKITKDYGDAVVAPADPTKTGYTFAGWYSDKDLTTTYDVPATMPAENITVYAKWSMNALTIKQTGVEAGDTVIYQVVGDSLNLTVVIVGTSEETESVTIELIPCGTYTVKEIDGDWTWTYVNTTEQSVTVSGETEVTFAHVSRHIDWLHHEYAALLPAPVGEEEDGEEET